MRGAALLAGVDAGATTIRAGVGERPERVLARASIRAVRLVEGVDRFATAVAAMLEGALVAAGGRRPAGALVVGAAGAGDEDTAAALGRALAETGIAKRRAVVTDAELVLADAFGDGMGIALIAGTGSIAMGRLATGALVRAGGLGPLSGDPGSGYAIGRAAVTAGDEALLRVLRQPDDSHVAPTWARTIDRAAPAEVAALAPMVLRAAKAGNRTAGRIVSDAAHALATLVSGLVARFAHPGVSVALAGGVLGDPWFRDRVGAEIAAVSPRVQVASEPPDGVRGALWLAARLAARTPSPGDTPRGSGRD